MTPSHAPSLLKTLIKLTLFLLALQIAMIIITVVDSGIASMAIAKSVLIQLITSPVIFHPLLAYLGIQLLLQALFVGTIWLLARGISAHFSLKPTTTYSLGIMLWLFYVVLIFMVNTLAFNQSLFALFTISSSYNALLYLGYFSLLIIPALLAFTKPWRPLLALLIFFSVCYTVQGYQQNTKVYAQADSKKPAIIIISVEALRPEFTSDMPFLNKLLTTSVRYTDAYTPIAQSFPSWISILTSRTPLHQGARSLYTNYKNIDLQGSLLEKLRADGYYTVYAVDGQRFGEITSEIGFDKIISPPFGAAELLIGTISDSPFSNLVSLTPLGKYLFPYAYANRSFAITYQPQDYIDLLQTNLRELPHQPLFLIAHFSLSHWPYRWANDNKPSQETFINMYQRSLRRADQQISAFYQLLEKNKLLDHAIVILISDHGIGLGLPGDSFGAENKYIGKHNTFPALTKNPYSINQQSGYDTSYNYSTNILSLRQYHTLLAIKLYGTPAFTPHSVTTRTSLMDIAPTLSSLLNLPASNNWEGHSLFSTIPHRSFFMENGFTTPEIAKANIDANSVFQTAANWISIDPQTGLLSLTASAQQKLLANKERALLLDDWMLARLRTKTMVLINIKSGKWTADFSSSLARQAPLAMMLAKFKDYNAGEI